MKLIISLFCAIAALASLSEAYVRRYDGYQVYRIHFTSDEQFDILYKMDVSSSNDDVMFWQLSHSQHYADIMIAPKLIEETLQKFDGLGLSYELLIEDVQKNIDGEKSTMN